MIGRALAASALLAASLAGAQPPPAYGPGLADAREEMVRQLRRSYVCMFDASRAMMRQGVTDRDQVRAFAAGTCSAGASLAMRRAGFSDEDGAAVLGAVSGRAYDDALSWGRK